MSLIVANWKMNPTTPKAAQRLFSQVSSGIGETKDIEAVVCPPFVFLSELNQLNSLNALDFLKLGAQDCFWAGKGPFTGEISPLMLKNLGAEYVILGHSERRQYLGETDEMINAKIKACLKAKLVPILCVGDSSREDKEDIAQIRQQLTEDLKGLSAKELKKIIITYEPLWAISTSPGGKAATPKDAVKGAKYIRLVLSEMFGEEASQKTRVLYGGSVDSGNAFQFISNNEIQGVLVGGASLKPNEFLKLLRRLANPTIELNHKI